MIFCFESAKKIWRAKKGGKKTEEQCQIDPRSPTQKFKQTKWRPFFPLFDRFFRFKTIFVLVQMTVFKNDTF